jgi:hypothetical protein
LTRNREKGVWVRRGDQYRLTTQPHRDALLARMKRARRVDTAGDFGAEHGLEESRCRLRVVVAERSEGRQRCDVRRLLERRQPRFG